MYCKKCGSMIDEDSKFCRYCGAKTEKDITENNGDSASLGFAILGFFIPIAGLILFIIYEKNKPKRAKSAGKGALAGFITKVVLGIIVSVICVFYSASIFYNLIGDYTSSNQYVESEYEEESTDDINNNNVDVSFGKFNVSGKGYVAETSLEVTVTNKSERNCSYYITIEAVDKDGARIDTDTVYADRLRSGQSTCLTAFELVDKDKISQFKKATFYVLSIQKFDY